MSNNKLSYEQFNDRKSTLYYRLVAVHTLAVKQGVKMKRGYWEKELWEISKEAYDLSQKY